MQELSGWLGRVEAPPELWERVLGERVRGEGALPLPHGRGSVSALLSRDRQGAVGWLAFAALVAAAVLLFLLPPRELHSSDPSQVRSWVLSRTGVDLPLPSSLAPSVHILRASRPDRNTAKIEYQVNGRDAAMLVTMAAATVAGDGKHRLLNRSANSWSWTMHGVVYTVVSPSTEVSAVACQLCHSL